MSLERQKRLVERLLDRSRLGQIAWEETPEEDVFQVSFSQSKVQISSIRSGNFSNYQIRIADEYDTTTEIFDDNGLDKDEIFEASKWKNLMREVYGLARRKSLRADEVLDSILSEIG